MDKIYPFLWFDDQVEEAANFYVSLFERSKVLSVQQYGPGMPLPEGSVMVMDVELNGQRFTLLNGGPQYKISPAISFVVPCDSQEEVDRLWTALSEKGEEMPCGWVTDRFGVSWQVVPKRFFELVSTSDAKKTQAVMAAMMTMKKFVIADLERAAAEA